VVSIFSTIFQKKHAPTREHVEAVMQRELAEKKRNELLAAINAARDDTINDMVKNIVPKRGNEQ